jgi:hypothetical protein
MLILIFYVLFQIIFCNDVYVDSSFSTSNDDCGSSPSYGCVNVSVGFVKLVDLDFSQLIIVNEGDIGENFVCLIS